MSAFKICRCCGTKHRPLARKCRRCNVPALWDKPTAEQQAEHDAETARLVALSEQLLRDAA